MKAAPPTPELLEMWRRGVPDEQVAQLLGISVKAVATRRQRAARAGLIPMRREASVPLSVAERQRIRAMRLQGLTLDGIATALGRSRTTVRMAMRQMGLRGRLGWATAAPVQGAVQPGSCVTRPAMTLEEKRAAIARNAAGESWAEIAASLGRDVRVMHQAIQRQILRDEEAARAARRAALAADIERENRRLAERHMRLALGADSDATRRRIASLIARGERAHDAQQEAMRWHERRRA